MLNILYSLEKKILGINSKPKQSILIVERDYIQSLLMDCRETVSVTFKKKDGTMRTLTGLIEPHKNHTGINPVAHLGKYITITENWNSETPKFRNANMHTIDNVVIGSVKYIVKGDLTDGKLYF